MARSSPAHLKPRKTPRQTRSAVTVEAILAATIQVLLADGPSQLTTTRVAERAGVSVGTMYQYFPHKQALLYALLKQQLDGVVQTMEAAAARLSGRPLVEISDGLASAWLDAKTRDVEGSRALYAVALDFDIADLMDDGTRRVRTAIAQALDSAPDAPFPNLARIAFTLSAVLGGAVRFALEDGEASSSLAALRVELPLVCRSYLAASVAGRRAS